VVTSELAIIMMGSNQIRKAPTINSKAIPIDSSGINATNPRLKAIMIKIVINRFIACSRVSISVLN
tara:strand:+ start:893 stop:1090 length:198 start_codon:yes stop_codon:yes gene_type:complete